MWHFNPWVFEAPNIFYLEVKSVLPLLDHPDDYIETEVIPRNTTFSKFALQIY
jgi:hypothetical protein